MASLDLGPAISTAWQYAEKAFLPLASAYIAHLFAQRAGRKANLHREAFEAFRQVERDRHEFAQAFMDLRISRYNSKVRRFTSQSDPRVIADKEHRYQLGEILRAKAIDLRSDAKWLTLLFGEASVPVVTRLQRWCVMGQVLVGNKGTFPPPDDCLVKLNDEAIEIAKEMDRLWKARVDRKYTSGWKTPSDTPSPEVQEWIERWMGPSKSASPTESGPLGGEGETSPPAVANSGSH
ncbi:hypothetical protein Pan44_02520 [Caulifigura coniformis]|uniref:Uncharacterized protein n=1 Tax=Caulifigura coniformis TaxID=2527983 RepID=A0A517S824_9PLAN|nr:hypothetical protein Pan44_02520 [Caulifigura coniformis]